MRAYQRMALGGLVLAAALAWLAGAAGGASGSRDAGWVDRKVAECSLKESEVPLDHLAWAPGLPEALALAQRHRRLVYLLIDRGDVVKGRA